MHTLSLSLLTLASFLLSIAAGPLAIRDAASNVRALASDLFPPLIFQQKPICTGDFEDNVTMQSHCVGALGATCGFAVVFPDSTQSGNKDNCGNACSCTSSVRTPEDRKDTPRHLPSPPPPLFWERQATLTWRRTALPCHSTARIQTARATILKAVLAEDRMSDVLARAKAITL